MSVKLLLSRMGCVLGTCRRAGPALLLQLTQAFLQSCTAARDLLLDSFLLVCQAASTRNTNQLLKLYCNRNVTSLNVVLGIVHTHTLTCQRLPVPRGQWGGSWSRRPGQWIDDQLRPSRPTWCHCSGVACTSPHARSDPVHIQQLQRVIQDCTANTQTVTLETTKQPRPQRDHWPLIGFYRENRMDQKKLYISCWHYTVCQITSGKMKYRFVLKQIWELLFTNSVLNNLKWIVKWTVQDCAPPGSARAHCPEHQRT